MFTKRFSTSLLAIAVLVIASFVTPFSSHVAPAFATANLSLPSGQQAMTTVFGDLCADSCVLSGFGPTDEIRVVITSDSGAGLSGKVRLTPGTTVSALDPVTGYNGGLVANMTAEAGHSEIAFIGTQAEVNAVLPELQYKGASVGSSETVSISATLAGLAGRTLHYFPGNGHYYEFVDANATWSAATTAAEGRSFNGLTGYLATILTEDENNFIKNKITNPNLWMGAEFTSATVSSPTYPVNTAGAWNWVTGPAGDRFQFWSGTRLGTSVTPVGALVPRYANWNTGQPDGSSDCAVVNFDGAGKWDDYGCSHSLDFLVEFGGLAGQTPTLELLTTLEVFVPFTLSYNANANQHQSGVVTGSVPVSEAQRSGTTVTVAANSGSLARQGFTFNGWNTAADGTGTPYAPGATFPLNASVTVHAQWGIPGAARLFGLTEGGVRKETIVPVKNVGGSALFGNIRGITTNGRSVFFMPSNQLSAAGIIREVGFDGTLIADRPVSGAGTNFQGTSLASRDLTYSSGCIFIRKDGTANSPLYCISTDTWSMSEVTVPTQVPPGGTTAVGLLPGNFWLDGNLIDFPDGRIGAVSQANWNTLNPTMAQGTGAGQCPASYHCKILRLYTVTGTGSAATLTFSEDIVLADNQSGWPSDDHGIATDGTYLYQSHFDQGYKSYALRSNAPSHITFNGNGSGPCGADSGTSGGLCPISNWTKNSLTVSNATYFGRDHVNKRYIMGDYDKPQFVMTTAATDQPVGVGTVSSSSAPRNVAGSGGNTQVTLSWQAPLSDGGSAVSSYTVTASPGGASCSTAATSCVITGLTNGTAYTFTVVAFNNGGPSPSASSSPVTPAVPAASGGGGSGGLSPSGIPAPVVVPLSPAVPRILTPPQAIPQPSVLQGPVTSPGRGFDPNAGTRATIGGAPATVTQQTLPGGGLSVTTGAFQMGVALSNPSGGGGVDTNNPSNRPELRVPQGQSTTVNGGGLLPGSQLQVWLPGRPGSTVNELARVPVRADGTFEAELSFTADRSSTPVPIGRQVMQVTGYDQNGNQTVVDMTINVAQGPISPEQNHAEGALPQLTLGASLATSAGFPTPVTVLALPGQKLLSVGDGQWLMTISVGGEQSSVEGTSEAPVIRMTQGSEASASGEGFLTGTTASVWMFSDPTLMATIPVGDDGTFTLEFLVDPQFLLAGSHTLQVQGVGEDGFLKAANLGVVVDEVVVFTATTASELLLWGVLVAALFLASGLIIFLARRRTARAKRALGRAPERPVVLHPAGH